MADKILSSEILIVRTTGKQKFKDKKGKVQVRDGPLYFHFLESCLNNYFQSFEYKNISVPEDTKNGLTEQARNYLSSLGLNI